MGADLKEKLESDLEVTSRALERVEVIAPAQSYVRKIAEDFLGMARAYYEDATHFWAEGRPVDAGARLGVLDGGGDDRLFTLL
ncbi:MAG: DUF357 domain-containing protein [Thermoplasmata archaeon]